MALTSRLFVKECLIKRFPDRNKDESGSSTIQITAGLDDAKPAQRSSVPPTNPAEKFIFLPHFNVKIQCITTQERRPFEQRPGEPLAKSDYCPSEHSSVPSPRSPTSYTIEAQDDEAIENAPSAGLSSYNGEGVISHLSPTAPGAISSRLSPRAPKVKTPEDISHHRDELPPAEHKVEKPHDHEKPLTASFEIESHFEKYLPVLVDEVGKELQKLCTANASKSGTRESIKDTAVFNSRALDIRDYLTFIRTPQKCFMNPFMNPFVWVEMLLLLRKHGDLAQGGRLPCSFYNVHKLAVMSLVLIDQLSKDRPYFLTDYAKFCKIPGKELEKLQRIFLFATDFDITNLNPKLSRDTLYKLLFNAKDIKGKRKVSDCELRTLFEKIDENFFEEDAKCSVEPADEKDDSYDEVATRKSLPKVPFVRTEELRKLHEELVRQRDIYTGGIGNGVWDEDDDSDDEKPVKKSSFPLSLRNS